MKALYCSRVKTESPTMSFMTDSSSSWS